MLSIRFTFAQGNTPDEKTSLFLKKFRTEYAQAFAEKMPGTIAAYYSDDVRLMPEYQKTVITKANVLLYLKAYIARFDIKEFLRQEIEIMDLGTRVVEFGLFTQKLSLKGKTEPIELKGKYCDIWQRTPEGKLSLITEAWNYSHPVKIGQDLVFPDVPSVNVAMQSHVAVNSPIALELLAYNRLLESVITEHNPKLWRMFYADDYMLFYSGHSVYKGRKEIDAYLEEHVKQLPVFEKLDIRTEKIDELDGYVIEYGSHIAIIRNGDWSGVGTGKDIRVWRREKNGTLRICRGVAMYD